MRRLVLAVLVALILAVLSGVAIHALYTSGALAVDVSDGDGHGPDEGSSEWRAAEERAIPFRSVRAGTIIGIASFFVAFHVLRPPRHPPA